MEIIGAIFANAFNFTLFVALKWTIPTILINHHAFLEVINYSYLYGLHGKIFLMTKPNFEEVLRVFEMEVQDGSTKAIVEELQPNADISEDLLKTCSIVSGWGNEMPAVEFDSDQLVALGDKVDGVHPTFIIRFHENEALKGE